MENLQGDSSSFTVDTALQSVSDLFSPTSNKPAPEAFLRQRAPLPEGPESSALQSSAADCQECCALGSVSYGRCQVCGESDSVDGPVSSSPSASTSSRFSQPFAKGLHIAEMFWEPRVCPGAEDEPSPCARAQVISPVDVGVVIRPNAQRALFSRPADDEDASAPSTPHKSEPTILQQDRDIGGAVSSLPPQSCDTAGCKSVEPMAVCGGDSETSWPIVKTKPRRATRSAPRPDVREEQTKHESASSEASPTQQTEPAPLRTCLLKTTPAKVNRQPQRAAAPSTSPKRPDKTKKGCSYLSLSVFALGVCMILGTFFEHRGAILDVGISWMKRAWLTDPLFASRNTSILDITAKYSHSLYAVEEGMQGDWLPSLRMMTVHRLDVEGSPETAQTRSSTELSIPLDASTDQTTPRHGRPGATSFEATRKRLSPGAKPASMPISHDAGAKTVTSLSSSNLTSLDMLFDSKFRAESPDTMMPGLAHVKLSLDTSLRNLSGESSGRQPAFRRSIASAPRQSVNWIHRRLVLGVYCKWYRYVATLMQSMGIASKKVNASIPLLGWIRPPKAVMSVAEAVADALIVSANSTLELLDCAPRDLLLAPSAS